MLAKVGKISGKTVKFLILLAKTLTNDRELGKQLAKLVFRSILPELAKKFTNLRYTINWKRLADLIIDSLFDIIDGTIDLNELLRQILDEVNDLNLEATFCLALTFAMRVSSIGVFFKQSEGTRLMVISSQKGTYIVLSFRF